MRKRILPGVIVCLGLLVTLLFLAGLLFQRPWPKSQVVAGGIRYTIEGVTFGTNHQFTSGFSLPPRLSRVLPKFVQNLLPSSYHTENQTSEPEALVYVSAFDTSRQIYVSPNFDDFRVYDEHGCAFHVNSWSSASAAPTFSVTSLQLRSFPRRGRDFRLRMYPRGNLPYVELTVPNPVKGPFPQWAPEALPIRRNVDRMTFELTGFQPHWGANGDHYVQPIFSTLRDGTNVTREWRNIPQFTDATGNRASALCPYEPAWRIETKFVKNSKGTFRPDQSWRIPSMPVPGDGRMVVFNQNHTLSNVTLHLIALTGPGEFKMSNGVLVSSAPWRSGMAAVGSSSSTSMENGIRREIIHFSSDGPTVLLAITNLTSTEDLLIRCRDQTGRISESTSWSSANHHYRFKLPKLPNATSIDLEMILQEPVELSFAVEPPKPPGR
jgi:hypothetical protein